MSALYLGLFALSAASLLLEVGLTRVLAISQWYHYAFLVVSLALLGYGAGGSLHAALFRSGHAPRRGLMAGLAGCFALTCAGILLVQHLLPLDLYILAWEPRQILYLAAEYLSMSLPFLAVGLVTSLLLEAHPEQAGPLYAASLTGSALGTGLAPLLLDVLGSDRTPLAAGLLSTLAAGLFLLPDRGPTGSAAHPPARCWSRPLLALPLAAAMAFLLLSPPEPLALRLDPHKSLVQQLYFPDAELLHSEENAVSRVDVVAGGPYHSFPGLSLIHEGVLPPQMALTLDGDHPSPLTHYEPGRTDTTFLDSMLSALPFQLRPGARTLLIEPIGGLDLLQALEQGARQVTVLLENPLVREMVSERFSPYIGEIFRRPEVTIEARGARSFLAHGEGGYDLIFFSLTGARAVVTAGAYSLTEEDLLTVEAFRNALGQLAPGGMVAVMRWLQEPPSEELRALSTMTAALEGEGVGDPAASLIALRSWSTMLLLARQEPWTAAEIAQVRSWSQEQRFDPVWWTELDAQEANRYNRIREGPIYYEAVRAFLETEDRTAFFRSWPADVRPTRDERPFFYHFFRWQQLPEILQQFGRTVQPFGGAGFLVVPALGLLALLASGGLILLPLALARQRAAVRGRGWTLLFFSALGLGFMGLEIPLLGRLTLFLDQPLYATTTVLFALLLGSGVGSRLLGSRPAWLRPTLGLLILLAGAYAIGLPPLLEGLLALPLASRLAIAIALLLPLGVVMGVPVPAGVRLLGEGRRPLIPWAWAVNGCASVLGAIAAQTAALTWGYGAVLLAGAACYALAWAVAPKLS